MEPVLTLHDHVARLLLRLGVVRAVLVLDQEHAVGIEARLQLEQTGLETIEQELLGVVLHRPLGRGHEVVGHQVLVGRFELLGGELPLAVATEADLVERLRLEVRVHAVNRGSIAPEDHRWSRGCGLAFRSYRG